MAISFAIVPEGTKSAGLEAEERKPTSVLQAIHGRIFAVDVVAHLRFGHGACAWPESAA